MPDRCSTLHLTLVFLNRTLPPTHSSSSSRHPSTSSEPGNTFLTDPTFRISIFSPHSLVEVRAFQTTDKPTPQTACCRRRPIGPQEYRLPFRYSISFRFGRSAVPKQATKSLRRLATNRQCRTLKHRTHAPELLWTPRCK